MADAVTTAPTLAGALWPSSAENRIWRAVLLAVLGSAFLALLAQIEIPFWPVPQTMQTFGVMVIGMTYGWRLAGSTIALYLVEGAVGLPVFAGGASAAALVGPTAGYLFGFVLGGMAMGWLAERGWDRHPVTAVAAMLIGDAIVFVLGYAWLAYVIGDAGKAFELGVTPFLFGDACKIALVAAGLPLTWKLLRR
ncbi:MAG TPA: biotin transporter BioY [Kiloniellales bacterium]|nr:biotin transporter BioY [Kiloniellales bacterium]